MFKSLKKIKEYVMLGQAMDKLNTQLDRLNSEVEYSYNKSRFTEDVIGLSFVIRYEIFDRIDEYNWAFEGPIRVASISSSNISLLKAYTTISAKIRTLALTIDTETFDSVNNVLEKGDIYFKLKDISKSRG
jgi:hypothetical protein